MGVTPGHGLRYPEAGDPSDVPTDVHELADDVERELSDLEAALATLSSLPTGALLPYAGATPPAGFLVCDGSPVSRTTYAALYAVIGVAFGAGDGANTFNLPDLRNRVPVGASGTKPRGATGGAEVHTLAASELPYHEHGPGPGMPYYAGTTYAPQGGAGTAFAAVNINSSSTGGPTAAGGQAHNNMQPYVAIGYLIKT